MKNDPEYCIILTTTDKDEEATSLAKTLCENKLAGCVQIQKINTFYSWKGKVQSGPENLLFIKTKADLYPKVEEFIRKNHSYEIPEIIQLSIENGLPEYLNWIDQVTELK